MENKEEFGNQIIPFWCGKRPRLFEIERRGMDRDGKVIDFFNQHLSEGLVLDIGAGNDFTAIRLTTRKRTVIRLEPDEEMIDSGIPSAWTHAVAQIGSRRVLEKAGFSYSHSIPEWNRNLYAIKNLVRADETNRIQAESSEIERTYQP